MFCESEIPNPLGMLLREALYFPLGFDIGFCEDCTIDAIVGMTDVFITALHSEHNDSICR